MRHSSVLAAGTTRPRKITHVNLDAADRNLTCDFRDRTLGFRLIDETAVNCFLCCGADRHSLVVGAHGMCSLNQVALEMDDLDSVMRGAGRLALAVRPAEPVGCDGSAEPPVAQNPAADALHGRRVAGCASGIDRGSKKPRQGLRP